MKLPWLFRLSKLAGSWSRSRPARVWGIAKLCLEPLEDRTLPSSLLPGTDPFANAQTVVVSGKGITSQAGLIANPGEVDTFRFTAPLTGLMAIELSPSPVNVFQPHLLDLFDGSQNVISPAPSPTSAAFFEPWSVNVIRGSNYFVQVGAGPGNSS